MKTCHHHLGMCVTLTLCVVCMWGNALHAQGSGYVSIEFGTRDTVVAEAGEMVYFHLVARDAQGDTIKNWNTVGMNIELRVLNATANLDTSTTSWNADPDGYTWLHIFLKGTIITQISDHKFYLPYAEFENGTVRLGFLSTKVEVGMRIEVYPYVDSVASLSPPITTVSLRADNLLVQYTPQREWPQREWQSASTFYQGRPIELFVTPRDRFMNPLDTTLDVGFMVNHPDEFSAVPGHPFPPFASRQNITGEHAFYLSPDTFRIRGESSGYVITAYCPDNFGITGMCDSIYAAPHAPRPFALLSPGHDTEVKLESWDDSLSMHWEQPIPTDPYVDIRVYRDQSRTYSDTVRYRIHFAAADSLENEIILDADDNGMAPSFTCTQGFFAGIADSLLGSSDIHHFKMIYYVEATDGVDTTFSTPIDSTLPGNRFRIASDLADRGIAVQFASQDPIERLAGEEISFDLVALDRNNNVVTNWDDIGRPVVLRVPGSSAESDTSTRAWNSDPNGYSWARLEVNGMEIAASAPGEYPLPKTLFVDGRASATYASSKAEESVFLRIHPMNARWNQTSPPVTWRPLPLDNILVDITWPHAERQAVYFERPYELYIVARDRYLNPLSDSTSLRLNLRYPDEILVVRDSLRLPVDSLLTISGEAAMFLVSTAARDDSTTESLMQNITAHVLADPAVRGEVPSYTVLKHPPKPFALQSPVDQERYKFDQWSWYLDFTWTRSEAPDPYSDIIVSRYSNTRTSDTVRYTLHLLRMPDRQKGLTFLSDDSGMSAERRFDPGQLHTIYREFAGPGTYGIQEVLWFVEATDGIFTTWSTPPDTVLIGNRLRLELQNPTVIESEKLVPTSLLPNYPNPFREGTHIRFHLEKAQAVSLTISDCYGRVVQHLLEGEHRDAGLHQTRFDATGLSPGVYYYRLHTDSQVLTGKMMRLR